MSVAPVVLFVGQPISVPRWVAPRAVTRRSCWKTAPQARGVVVLCVTRHGVVEGRFGSVTFVVADLPEE
jgi:hypothetical protein